MSQTVKEIIEFININLAAYNEEIQESIKRKNNFLLSFWDGRSSAFKTIKNFIEK